MAALAMLWHAKYNIQTILTNHNTRCRFHLALRSTDAHAK
jgi:hypothetical protein